MRYSYLLGLIGVLFLAGCSAYKVSSIGPSEASVDSRYEGRLYQISYKKATDFDMVSDVCKKEAAKVSNDNKYEYFTFLDKKENNAVFNGGKKTADVVYTVLLLNKEDLVNYRNYYKVSNYL